MIYAPNSDAKSVSGSTEHLKTTLAKLGQCLTHTHTHTHTYTTHTATHTVTVFIVNTTGMILLQWTVQCTRMIKLLDYY